MSMTSHYPLRFRPQSSLSPAPRYRSSESPRALTPPAPLPLADAPGATAGIDSSGFFSRTFTFTITCGNTFRSAVSSSMLFPGPRDQVQHHQGRQQPVAGGCQVREQDVALTARHPAPHRASASAPAHSDRQLAARSMRMPDRLRPPPGPCSTSSLPPPGYRSAARVLQVARRH